MYLNNTVSPSLTYKVPQEMERGDRAIKLDIISFYQINLLEQISRTHLIISTILMFIYVVLYMLGNDAIYCKNFVHLSLNNAKNGKSE